MSESNHEQVRHEAGRRRVVQHGRASTTSSIAHALVIKDDELFFLCEPDGAVPFEGSNGLGLYYHDCRYLDGYELRLDQISADRLGSTASAGSSATLVLTNRDVKTAGNDLLDKESLGIRWERTLDSAQRAMHDTITFTNYGVKPVEVPVTIALRCNFESLFAVRGAQQKKRGDLRRPRWSGSTLDFEYDGADGLRRTLAAAFDPAPNHQGDGTAAFSLSIQARAAGTIRVSLHLHEGPEKGEHQPVRKPAAGNEHVGRTRDAQCKASDEWMAHATRLHSNDARLNQVVERSLRDLHLLRTRLRDLEYFAAGVPWYVTLFGRDAIISALETLAFLPDRAEDTARLLASFQGARDDDWRDEQPGKIMHELRMGEMARLGEIPQTPYYGTVDATPLFLILIARHAQWTGRLDLFNELRSHVEAALGWIDRSIASSGTGYLSYATKSGSGLSNQGWKDSGDSIMNADGSLATPPIALVEVQGYVYMAKHAVADLYRRAGDAQRADRLAHEAQDLQHRFERDFWLDDLGTYALALQENKRPAAVTASNAAHALWTGIASPERAAKVARRLMEPDMFSGWGIRTLSTRERRYNPIGYHDGTVWPHDNAIAVAGFRRYGRIQDIPRIVDGIVDAATHFEHHRLPEVFAGFQREEFALPVHYPVACHPQAWAAGAVPFMMESSLGLVADAFNERLEIVRPLLPDSVRELTLTHLRVADAVVDIRFRRSDSGDVHVDVDRAGRTGRLDVVVR